MSSLIREVIPALLGFLYIAVGVYFVLLAGRLVQAVEKIADKFENLRPPTQSSS
jgi:hypothetical protein